jgi:hypothetical protein
MSITGWFTLIDQSIVTLRTVEDLKKVLFMQRLITGQAKKELLAVASDAELLQDPTNAQKKAAAFMADERKILEKYANNPTLTEFNLMPNLAAGTRWGATFGVTLLVGELILEQVKAMQGLFEPMLRRLFLILLMELDRPKHHYLVEPLEKALRFKINKPDGGPVPLEEQEAYRKRLVHNLAESFIIVSIEYGLVQTKSEGFQITNLGKRVLLHLLDAEKFVTLLVEAHARFQTIHPPSQIH